MRKSSWCSTANRSAAVAGRVPFEAGSLRAFGKNKGRVIADYELHTTGRPAQILLRAGEQSKQHLLPLCGNVWERAIFRGEGENDGRGLFYGRQNTLSTMHDAEAFLAGHNRNCAHPSQNAGILIVDRSRANHGGTHGCERNN